jgi:hypothetical protein
MPILLLFSVNDSQNSHSSRITPSMGLNYEKDKGTIRIFAENVKGINKYEREGFEYLYE